MKGKNVYNVYIHLPQKWVRDMGKADVHQNFNFFFDGLEMRRQTDNRTEQMRLHHRLGEGSVHRWVPRADLGMAIADFKLRQDRKIDLHTEAAMVELSYCLQGSRDILVSGKRYEVAPESYCLQFVNPTEASMHFSKDQSFQMLSIGIPVSTFHHFMEEGTGTRSVDFYHIIGNMPYRLFQEKMDPATSILLQQMLKSSMEQCVRNVEMEYRILELVSYAFRSFLLDGKQASIKLSRTDMDKIEQARDIIVARMADPPSLMELSRIIGMSDYKLKICFKRMYGTTVFGYLRDRRLELAYRLLQEGSSSVIDVSYAVGYTNPSYFSEAFRRKYGSNPGEILRRL